MVKVKSKVWLETEDGSLLFSDGRQALFKAIMETGSINQAAKSLGMSYRAAWGKIHATEERLGIKLVETQAGGNHGGGAHLTQEAEELLKRYDAFKEMANAAVDHIFDEFFPNSRTGRETITEKVIR